MRRVEGEDQFSCCSDLDPEPLGHDPDPPVRVQLVAHEAQEAGLVGNPGNHQAAGGGQQRNRKLFQLRGGQATVPSTSLHRLVFPRRVENYQVKLLTVVDERLYLGEVRQQEG